MTSDLIMMGLFIAQGVMCMACGYNWGRSDSGNDLERYKIKVRAKLELEKFRWVTPINGACKSKEGEDTIAIR